MATNYPNSLDNFTNPTSASPINSPSHSEQHANANDAIEAIEGELGTSPKGAKATVKARLDDVDTAIATKAPIASPTFTGTVTIPSGSAITGVPYLATANTFTGNNTFASPIVGFVGTSGAYSSVAVSAYNIIHLSQGMIFINSQTGGDYNLGTNTYYNSGWKYFESSGSTLINFGNGRFNFSTAPSGTAGNAITYTSKMIIANSGTVTVNGFDAASKGLIVKGAASQTANLQEWQDSSGFGYASMSPYGLFATAGGIKSFGNVAIGVNGTFFSAALSVESGSTTGVAVKVRGVASQTANLEEWQNSAGSVLSYVDSAGKIFGNGLRLDGSDGSNNNIYKTGTLGLLSGLGIQLYLNQDNNATGGSLVIRAINAQTSNLTEWKNVAGTVLASIGSGGVVTAAKDVWHLSTDTRQRLLYAGDGASIYKTYTSHDWRNASDVLTNRFDANGGQQNLIQAATTVGLIVKGAASQTADLQQWQDSASNILLAVTQNGSIYNPSAIGRTSIGMQSGAYFQVFGDNWTTPGQRGGAEFVFSSENSGTGGFTVFQYQSGAWNPKFKIFNSGYTSINSTSSTLGSSSATHQLGVVSASAATVGAVIRGAASQTAKLQEWQNSAGNVVAWTSVEGNGYFQANLNAASIGAGNNIGGASLTASPWSAVTTVSIIRGYPSQTGDLTQWQNSSGTVVAKVNAAGNIGIGAGTTALSYGLDVFTGSARIWNGITGAGQTGTLYLGDGSLTKSYGSGWELYGALVTTGGYGISSNANLDAGGTTLGYGRLSVNTGATTTVGAVIRGVASQTANLQEWQNSVGTVLAKIDATGKLTSTVDVSINGYVIGKGAATTGTSNIAFGQLALASNTTGSGNFAIGVGVLQSNTTGNNNFALGANSLINSTTGDLNMALGSGIMYYLTTGAYNVGIGYGALSGATTGYENLSIGISSLTSTTTGFRNTAIGQGAGYLNVTGSSNVFLGYNAGYNETGSNKLYIANTNTATPLIGGDFSAKTLTVAGSTSIISQNASSSVLLVKAAASQAGSIIQWQNSSGSTIGEITNQGIFRNTYNYVQNLQGLGGGSGLYLNDVTTTAFNTNPANLVFKVQGFASQTANLQEWQDSAGTVLASVGPTGGLTTNSTGYSNTALSIVNNSSTVFEINQYGQSWNSTNSTFGNYYNTDGGTLPRLSVFTSGAGQKGAIIRGAASQTANLQEWQNSAGTALSYIKPDGSLYVVGNSNTAWISGPSTSGTNQISANGNDLAFSPYFDGLFAPANAAGRWRPVNDATSDLGTSGQRWKDVYATSAVLNSNSASKVGLVVKGAASQTANLQEWQNFAGYAGTAIDSSGSFYAPGIYSSYLMQATAGGAAVVPLTVKSAASQTANLQEWQNSGGTALSRVAPKGNIYVGATQTGLSGQVNGSGVVTQNTSPLFVRGTQSGQNLIELWAYGKDAFITGAVGNGTSVTYTTSIAHGFTTSDYVIINGISYSGGSGNLNIPGGNTVSAVTTYTFTVPNTSTQTYTSGGYVRNAEYPSNILQAYRSDGMSLFTIGGSGGFAMADVMSVANVGYQQAGLSIQPNLTSSAAIRMYGRSAQTAEVLDVRNYIYKSGGSDSIFAIVPDYSVSANADGYSAWVRMRNAATPTVNPTSAGYLYVGSGALNYMGTSNVPQQIVGADGSVKFTSPAAGVIPLIIQHTASPTSSYFEIRNSAGTALWGINSAGESLTRTTTKYGANIQNDSNNNNTALSISAPSSGGSGVALYIYSGSTTRDIAKFDNSGTVKLTITSDGSLKGGNSSTISANTATTVDTVAISSFTTIEYTISIKQGSKVRSSKVLVHTDGTSIDSTEYGIMEMGGGITGILVTASVSSTNSILEVTITDAATTNATVKLIKTML